MGLPEDVKVINRYVVIQFNLPFLTPAFLHLLLSQQETVTQSPSLSPNLQFRAAKSPSKFTKFPRFCDSDFLSLPEKEPDLLIAEVT